MIIPRGVYMVTERFEAYGRLDGAELHRIDQAYAGLDPELAEILDEGGVVRLKRRLVDQKLDGENLAVRQPPLAVLDLEPRLLQQLLRPAQQRAILPRTIRHRRHEGFAEHLFRHPSAIRLKQCKLGRRRWALRHHV